MYRLIEYGSMLRDRRRIDAYTRALSSVISTSSIVLDLGAGLGTFSVLACRMGAARVYAVEPADIITVAEEIARTNGVADRIQFIQARAAEIELPENVDVIVSDLSGALPLFEEHLVSVMHVRDRFLARGGVLIPERDRLLCAPISNSELYSRIVEPWISLNGIDLGIAKNMALNAPHARLVEAGDLAAEPRCWAELEYATLTSPNVSASIEWQLDAASIIHGIALWFESTLHGDITMSTGPGFPESVHSTIVLPLLEPLRVGEGEVLRLTLGATLAAGRYVVSWQAGTERQPGARQSTFLSEPRSGASLVARTTAESAVTTIPSDASFRVSNQVLARRVGNDTLLLDLRSGIYHVLNATGAQVWKLLENGGGIGSIAAAIASDCDVDPQRAIEDVTMIVEQLQHAGLITQK